MNIPQIKITDKTIIDTDDFNLFKSIGTEGFSLYCYFLAHNNSNNQCETTINIIKNFFSSSIKTNIKLKYGESKKCAVSILKDKKTIAKYINVLIRNNLILVNSEDEISCNLNAHLKITTIKPFEFDILKATLDKFYLKTISKIGTIGWSLLSVLNVLLSNSNLPYITPTERELANILKKDEKTIRVYLRLLEEYKILRIEAQEPIFKGKDKNGIDFFEFMPNKYFFNTDDISIFNDIHNKNSIPKKKTNDNKSGYLYAITINDIEYKIGKTKDFNKRLGEYTLLPYKPRLLFLVKVKDCSRGEDFLHEKFKEKRLRGEWFKLNKIDIKYFESCEFLEDFKNDLIENMDVKLIKID